MPSTKMSTELREFVQNQTIIRVYADSNPGSGNQAFVVDLIEYFFKVMEFRGTIELIYPEEIADKIFSLYNLPPETSTVYFDRDKKILFIDNVAHLERFKDPNFETLMLGATVSDANLERMIPRSRALSIHEKFNEKNIISNPANFANVRFFIQLQPWFNRPTRPTEISMLDLTVSIDQEGSDTKFFSFTTTSFEEAKAYLQKHPKGMKLADEKPALTTFINGIETEKFIVVPVYGYTIQKYSQMLCMANDEKNCRPFAVFPEVYPANILQIIAAIRYAQIRTNNPAIVIPVFYNYQEEVTELLALINNKTWQDDTKPGVENLKKALEVLKVANVFSSANLSDKDACEKINNIQPGKILLLSMGRLPKIVFDGLYMHTADNIWPAIREGENSMHHLISLGIPHVYCGTPHSVGWKHDLELSDDTDFKKHMTEMYSEKGICRGMDGWKTNPYSYRQLGKFFIEAKKPNSSISKYFHRLQQEALKPENDRVLYAVEEVLHMYNHEKRMTQKHEDIDQKPSKLITMPKLISLSKKTTYPLSLSLDATVILGSYTLSLIINYITPKLPWNKRHTLSTTELEKIDLYSKKYAAMEKEFSLNKYQRAYRYGYQSNKHEDTKYLMKKVMELLITISTTQQATSSEITQIDSLLLRIECNLSKLTDKTLDRIFKRKDKRAKKKNTALTEVSFFKSPILEYHSTTDSQLNPLIMNIH